MSSPYKEIRDRVLQLRGKPVIICVIGKPCTGKTTITPWIARAIWELFLGTSRVESYELDRTVFLQGVSFHKDKFYVFEGIQVISSLKKCGYTPDIVIKLVASEETRKLNSKSINRRKEFIEMLFHPLWWCRNPKEDDYEGAIVIDTTNRPTKQEIYEGIANISTSHAI